jgi:hypothetical protein
VNWDAIAAIGEILGAIGVIVSVVYLATQIRQNSRWLRATFDQGTAEKITDSAGLDSEHV